MTARCCAAGGGRSRSLARRLFGAGSMAPGLLLVLLPKCPLCLAAWLTMATGISIPGAAAAGVRGVIVVFWVAGVALAYFGAMRAARRPSS